MSTMQLILDAYEGNKKHLDRIFKDEFRNYIKSQENSDEAVKQLILRTLGRFQEKFLPEIERVWTQTNAHEESWNNMDLFFDKPTLVEQKQLAKVDKRVRRLFSRMLDKVTDYERVKAEANSASQQPGDGNPKGVD